MQLKKAAPGALRLGLMAASCSLLGGPAFAQSATDVSTEDETPWQWDVGLLYYKENLDRVKATEPVISLRKDFGDDEIFTMSLGFDTLSGGSPNGAIPSRKAQTFASPSGVRLSDAGGAPVTYTTPSGQTVAQERNISLYTTEPRQLPIDPGFHDTRIATDASWTEPWGDANHYSIGGHLSKEDDFLSVAANAGLSRDFNSKNTTLGFGVNLESDSIRPIGGAPVPGTDFRLLDKLNNRSKDVTGGLLGLTQVMARNWIAEFNYSYDKSHGYLTDPYRILSVIDANGLLTDYRFESRPDTRTRQALYWGNKVALGNTVLDVSFRHGSDDWSIHSNTADARLRFNIGSPDIYLEPHVRWYHQSQADFYHLFLNSADTLPEYMSADPRLAAFDATTIGAKLGFLLQDQSEMTFRLELYKQDPTDSSSSLPGLTGLDLNPGLKSVIFQVGWRHGF
jgi:Protein of unknown function (DUF3570)